MYTADTVIGFPNESSRLNDDHNGVVCERCEVLCRCCKLEMLCFGTHKSNVVVHQVPMVSFPGRVHGTRQ